MKTTALLLSMLFSVYGCTSSESGRADTEKTKKLQIENDSLQSIVDKNRAGMEQQLAVSLTFQNNNAEPAMNYYVDLFSNAKIIELHRWEKDGPGKEGTIMQASFELNGMKFICSDSPPVHNWNFTPAVSVYVECEGQDEIERLFSKLSENGEVAMPLDNYGFSQKFGWLVDQFGVSWQLNLQ